MSTIVESSWLNAVSGAWTLATNWNPAVVPTYNTTTTTEYDVSLGGATTSGTTAFTVTSSANEQIGYLWVNSNATLALTGGVLEIYSTINSFVSTYNLGTFDIDSGATVMFGGVGNPSTDGSELWNAGAVNVSSGTFKIASPYFRLLGTGAFVLTGGKIVGTMSGGVHTFDNKTDTITGSGTIGNGAGATAGSLYLQNDSQGTINANAAAALVLNTGTNQIENAGTIETTGAGGLAIDSSMQLDGQLDANGSGALSINGAYVQGGGDVNVGAKGKLVLNNGGFAVGGIVSIAAGGTLASTAGNTTAIGANGADGDAATFAGDVLNTVVDNSGTISVANDSTLNLDGSLYGAGQLLVNGSSGPTKLVVFGNGVGLHGPGGVVLSNSAENSIVSNGTGQQISNYATISGAGIFGDGYLRLYNSPTGVVDATDSVGMRLVADTNAVTNGSEKDNFNAGLVETTGTGGLTITGEFDNAGYLNAAGAGALTLNGTQIDSGGGIVETTGTGSIVLKTNAEIYNQAYLSISTGGKLSTTAGDVSDAIETNVNNNGTISVVNGSTLVVEGQWQNFGAVTANGTTSATSIEIEAGKTWNLLDTGTVNLNGADSSILSAGAGAQLYNRGSTIEGSGVIGDANMAISNVAGGVIDATGATGLKIDATAETSGDTYLYNAGTIESNSAGGLTIETAMYSPGQLIANTGGNIVAQDAVYGPGVATINGTGSIEFGAEADNDVYFGSGGAGALILDQSDSAANPFYGLVYGFGAGDSVDLRDFAYKAGATSVDTTHSGFSPLDAFLVLTNGTTDSSGFSLEGNYTAANLTADHLAFQVTSDGHQIGTTGTYGTEVKLVSTA